MNWLTREYEKPLEEDMKSLIDAAPKDTLGRWRFVVMEHNTILVLGIASPPSVALIFTSRLFFFLICFD
jgi:hypothetical protein